MKKSGAFDLKSKLPLFNKQNCESSEQQRAAEPEGESLRPKNKVLEALRILCLAVFRLRALFLSIPVIFAALRLAAYNSEHLPLLVGLDLQSNGEFARVISRQSAVTWPLILTAACLTLMFFSRKTIYPWLISVFSLVIPVLLLVTNMYPA